MTELKPVSSVSMIDYDTGNYRDVKVFTNKDLIIDNEFATVSSGFALRFCDDKRNGFFVEIGASDWKTNNNTYFLEKEFGWKGLAIDIQKHFCDEYNKNRVSSCIHGDAMSCNWDKYFEENNVPKRIDFLQIDIDMNPKYANLLALINLPLSRYRFSTIVLEHASVLDKSLENMKKIQHEILYSYGYKLVAEGFNDDWWIDSQLGISDSSFNSITYEAWSKQFFV